MELQQYLLNRGLNKLIEQYKIKVNRHSLFNNLVCLKYSQRESPLEEKIVQQCRGIILDENNSWSIISYPYDKFFNYGEFNAPELDWNTAKIYEKLDGSLMTLYHHKGQWQVASSGKADAGGKVNDYKFTFAQLFWQVWNELGYQLPKKTNYSFMFELLTPINQVVVRQDSNRLILHGVRNLTTLTEEEPEPWATKNQWQVVNTYSFDNKNLILNATKRLNPMKSEGYVVRDCHFKRLKIKSAEYVAISLLQSDSNYLAKRILEVVVNNESSEFLTYYPQWINSYNRVKHKYDSLIEEIEQKYCQHEHLSSPKDFALAVKHLPYSKVLFDLRNGRSNSIKDSLISIPRDKLAHLLNL